jgi:hypothetical protein
MSIISIRESRIPSVGRFVDNLNRHYCTIMAEQRWGGRSTATPTIQGKKTARGGIRMRRASIIAGVLIGLAIACSSAQAQVRIGIGIGVPPPHVYRPYPYSYPYYYPPPYYYGYPRYYYSPYRVYAAPPPVYVAPPPGYVYQAPANSQPAAPTYSQPAPAYGRQVQASPNGTATGAKQTPAINQPSAPPGTYLLGPEPVVPSNSAPQAAPSNVPRTVPQPPTPNPPGPSSAGQ